MTKIYCIISIFCLILSMGSVSLASDSESSESSTAQTYYDYVLNRHQQQIDDLVKFKNEISGTVATLKEDLNAPNSAVKEGQDKYASTKETVVLGSLSGTKGKLAKEGSGVLTGVTGVTDTQSLGFGDTGKINPSDLIGRGAGTSTTPPVVITTPRQCHQVCRQVGYGQVCDTVCN